MSVELPKTFKKLVLKRQTTDFRKAVDIVEAPLLPPGDDEVLIKNKYVGVNATDINITGGKFYGIKPPADLGLEGVGEVVLIGKNVTNVKVGDSVAYFNMTAYSEYSRTTSDSVFVIPETKPELVALLVSGLTAAIGLDKAGRITEKETVLVTAAAGGCGHIAVQWAKAVGCHVIATCSSAEKTNILKDLGCDRIINYKTEDLDAVLAKEYPKGIDVIWETIGGEVFQTCVKHIATKGRLLVVGTITVYKDDDATKKLDLSDLPRQLLFKSAAVQGFIVSHYRECFSTYFSYLKERNVKDEIKILVDDGKASHGKEFIGMEGIIDAVEYLHSGKSIGKVTVRIS